MFDIVFLLTAAPCFIPRSFLWFIVNIHFISTLIMKGTLTPLFFALSALLSCAFAKPYLPYAPDVSARSGDIEYSTLEKRVTHSGEVSLKRTLSRITSTGPERASGRSPTIPPPIPSHAGEKQTRTTRWSPFHRQCTDREVIVVR